jgi:glucokinase
MVGWTNVPLRAIVAERTGLPIELGNDANAAALGEWLFGAGVGLRDLVYITVSTGIGGGVIADGRLLLGHLGAGAEVGHHIIESTTGAAWEDLAAGPGLAAAAAEAMITAVVAHVKTAKTTLKRVVFVLYQDEAFRAFSDTLKRVVGLQ